VSSRDRAEVVIFGDGGKMTGPFNLPVGNEYTVSVAAGGAEAVVAKIVSTRTGRPWRRRPVGPTWGPYS